jgi:hypothetical protein
MEEDRDESGICRDVFRETLLYVDGAETGWATVKDRVGDWLEIRRQLLVDRDLLNDVCRNYIVDPPTKASATTCLMTIETLIVSSITLAPKWEKVMPVQESNVRGILFGPVPVPGSMDAFRAHMNELLKIVIRGANALKTELLLVDEKYFENPGLDNPRRKAIIGAINTFLTSTNNGIVAKDAYAMMCHQMMNFITPSVHWFTDTFRQCNIVLYLYIDHTSPIMVQAATAFKALLRFSRPGVLKPTKYYDLTGDVGKFGEVLVDMNPREGGIHVIDLDQHTTAQAEGMVQAKMTTGTFGTITVFKKVSFDARVARSLFQAGSQEAEDNILIFFLRVMSDANRAASEHKIWYPTTTADPYHGNGKERKEPRELNPEQEEKRRRMWLQHQQQGGL